MLPFILNVQNSKPIEKESRLVVARGCEEEGMESVC